MTSALLRELASVAYADAGAAADARDFEESDRLLEVACDISDRADREEARELAELLVDAVRAA